MNLNLKTSLDSKHLDAFKSGIGLELFVDSLPHIAWISSASGAVEYLNQEWETFTGLSTAILGLDVLASVVHPDDFKMASEKLKSARLQGINLELEYRLKHKDGSYRWHLARSKPVFSSNGEIVKRIGTATDIHYQKKAELELRTLMEAVPDLVWRTNTQSQIDFANTAFFEYIGMSLEELHQKGWQSIIHPDDIEELKNKFLHAKDQKSAYQSEFRLKRKDGSYRWMSRNSRPILDSDGKITSWLGATAEIHVQKISELRANRLRNLSVLLVKAATFEEVIQTITNEVGVTLDASALELHWTDKLHSGAKFQNKIDVYSNYEAWIHNHPYSQLTPQAAAWASAPLWVDREIIGQICLSFDEPQEFSESHLYYIQYVFNECSQAIIRSKLVEEQALHSTRVVELQFITSELSKALTEPQVLEVIQKHVFKAFQAALGALFVPCSERTELKLVASTNYPLHFSKYDSFPIDVDLPLTQAFKKGEALFIEDISKVYQKFPTLMTISNDYKFVACACLPMVLNEKILGVFAFTYNCTKTFPENTQKMMQTLITHCAEALQRAKLYDLSEKAVKARDNLISISAHELLTPITGSKLQMQLLKKKLNEKIDISAESLLKVITRTDNNLDRLNKLVQDMIDLSRINFGKLTLKREWVDLTQLVQDTVDRKWAMMELAGCEPKILLPPQTMGFVDAYRIEQVIMNLISNACRYAYGKPITIELSKNPDHSVTLAIADQGMGIRMQDQDRIFERFERATSLNEKAGMGLGLFIVKQIVEAHGGFVTVESELEKGAKFIVTLPHKGPEELE